MLWPANSGAATVCDAACPDGELRGGTSVIVQRLTWPGEAISTCTAYGFRLTMGWPEGGTAGVATDTPTGLHGMIRLEGTSALFRELRASTRPI